jgi:lantibiotic biosynthesis protein
MKHPVPANKSCATLHELQRVVNSAQPDNWGLLGGRLGLCLYYAHRYEQTGLREMADSAVVHLEKVLEEAEVAPRGLSLSGGLIGLACVLFYMKQLQLVDEDLAAWLARLDQLIFEGAMVQLQSHENDYLHGAMGAVHYFVNRLPDAGCEVFVYELLGVFCNNAVKGSSGTWFRNRQLEGFDGEINLSLSHGLCGFLLILLTAYEKGIALTAIPEIVKEGIRLLLKDAIPASEEILKVNYFAQCVTLEGMVPQRSARLAWCYGDLNVLLVLYKAASVLQQAKWKVIADEYGAVISRRITIENTAIGNSHFCHGSSGLVAFYGSLYRYSPQPCYKEAYDFWLAKTDQYLSRELASRFYKNKEAGLLEGLLGVSFVLFDASLEGQDAKAPFYWKALFLLPI